jgi:hypothetical protein
MQQRGFILAKELKSLRERLHFLPGDMHFGSCRISRSSARHPWIHDRLPLLYQQNAALLSSGLRCDTTAGTTLADVATLRTLCLQITSFRI